MYRLRHMERKTLAVSTLGGGRELEHVRHLRKEEEEWEREGEKIIWSVGYSREEAPLHSICLQEERESIRGRWKMGG